MIKSLARYFVNKIQYPRLHFKVGSILKGEIKHSHNCQIGRGCNITNLVSGQNVLIEDQVYIGNAMIGENVRIYNGCSLYFVNIGRYTYISPNSVFSHTNIGSFCSIGRNVHCTGANHPTDFISTNPVFYSNRKQCGKSFTKHNLFDEFLHIEIGNDVWIGSNVTILGGVCISNGAIVGAGSVVTKDVYPYSIVVGNPARHLKFRFDKDIISELEDLCWWQWDDIKLLQNIQKFQSPVHNVL